MNCVIEVIRSWIYRYSISWGLDEEITNVTHGGSIVEVFEGLEVRIEWQRLLLTAPFYLEELDWYRVLFAQSLCHLSSRVRQSLPQLDRYVYLDESINELEDQIEH